MFEINQATIDNAVQYLVEGDEPDAATLLSACQVKNWESVDSWMDGNRVLDGLLLEVVCPRSTYEILQKENDPRTRSIRKAIEAVLPRGTYLKGVRARAVPSKDIAGRMPIRLTEHEIQELIEQIEAQKAAMISVATGGPRINDVNPEYQARRLKIKETLGKILVGDPNPYTDLWKWYAKWSDGSLPSYRSRRQYVGSLYQPVLDALATSRTRVVEPAEPTGWSRVDRNMEKIGSALETAKNEEDFQSVALLCREAIISLAQAVYDPQKHQQQLDGVVPSPTDAKRMFESYFLAELGGQCHEYHRKFARAVFDLAVNLQHKRTACFRDAAMCVEATRGIVNTLAILSGQRDPTE